MLVKTEGSETIYKSSAGLNLHNGAKKFILFNKAEDRDTCRATMIRSSMTQTTETYLFD